MPVSFRMSQSFSASFVSLPLMSTVPSLGSVKPFSSFANVDLPEPLCPSTQTKLPSSISMLTSSRALVFSTACPFSSVRT